MGLVCRVAVEVCVPWDGLVVLSGAVAFWCVGSGAVRGRFRPDRPCGKDGNDLGQSFVVWTLWNVAVHAEKGKQDFCVKI